MPRQNLLLTQGCGFGVAGIGLRQAIPNGEGRLIRVQRGPPDCPAPLHTADSPIQAMPSKPMAARAPDLPLWARSATVLHQPLIEPDDMKWRPAGQGATTVLNCAAQADIVRAAALCRVVR